MIKGIGIDIVELERIKTSLNNSNRFLQRILTDNEIEIYSDLRSDRRKLEFLAGRFAAKEAYSKAVGTGIGKLSFKDIEVIRLASGAPKLIVKDSKSANIFVSISHSEAYAIAQVIIEE
ncbi:holo-ACP synthase [Aquibacillus rhizosphaerae]|uniref:Holo-[acyl-carrier-protein] synthase n=1 Tax=Aquibacillus rhizosphaerae TaxID=3051431 RepID=A0ABT7L2S8_9BACI|nr:holo-ACP synthase [Aquibacillus sp. LR5S19]MDL4840152.1 holo-ACP synthase [Aquibacillus sp. LR5S19]